MAIQRGRDMKIKCGGRRQMNTDIKVEVIYKETITPSSPTPPHLKRVDLSVFDQMVPETQTHYRSGHAFTENLMGNFVWSYTAAMTVNTEVDLQSLVAAFRKCKEDYEVNFPNGVTAELAYQIIKESWKNLAKVGIDNYGCSSWCWFPFYETNFGWGKPSWVSTRGFQVKNTVVLMDAKDGDGIEASSTFIEEKMAIFESNQELLAYTSLNPSVI